MRRDIYYDLGFPIVYSKIYCLICFILPRHTLCYMPKCIINLFVFQVEIYAVITGHGSDENGCGEFCVTSHHFTVNKHVNNITFSEAG